ncbi:MAG: hypothetical protein M3Q71_07330 [Chloroflexota bacterium]|nr:hypothetical protein [Chloroflexota bacterium]MDP9470464.1 hypothetical protein [Chloroflexota bacterium]
MNYIADFELIKAELQGLSLVEVVNDRASEHALALTGALFDQIRERQRLPLDIFTLQDALHDAEKLWGVPARDLVAWGCRHFPADLHLEHLLAAFALTIFPNSEGMWFGSGEVNRRCADLPVNDDGLLDVRAAGAKPKQAGILIGPHYLHYHPWLNRYNLGLSGGFFEWLLNIASLPSTATSFLGFLVDPDIVMDHKHHREFFTREYIRGPKGLSVEQLNDPGFPDRPDGTVTEHLRIDPDGDHALLGMDLRTLQVMWSYRDGIKTVQMEELVPADAKEFAGAPYVANGYVHAQWHLNDACFRHFDGAVRIYDKRRYELRLGSDLRNHTSETRADDYVKLFRLDGSLRLEFWSNIVTRFYRHNELVIEYLGGEGDGDDDVRSLVVQELRGSYHRP